MCNVYICFAELLKVAVVATARRIRQIQTQWPTNFERLAELYFTTNQHHLSAVSSKEFNLKSKCVVLGHLSRMWMNINERGQERQNMDL